MNVVSFITGAVTILRNIDDINFNLLMSGKICFDEVSRVKRVARLGSVCLPAIMRDMAEYRKQLKKIAVVNGLHLPHPTHAAPQAYVQRLKERQAGVHRRRKVRKRKKIRASLSKLSCTGSEESKQSDKSSTRSTELVNAICAVPESVSFDHVGSSSDLKDPSSDAKGHMSAETKLTAVLKDVMKVPGLASTVPKKVNPGMASAVPKDTVKVSGLTVSITKDTKSSRRASKVFCVSADDITQAFVSDPNRMLDEQRTHTSLGRISARTKTSAEDEQRPSTANAQRRGRMTPLSKHYAEKMYHSPSVKENTEAKIRDGDSASPAVPKGLSVGFEDSLSVNHLSPSEEIKSWLVSLPPAFPSPSFVKPQAQPLPHVKLKLIKDSQVLSWQQINAVTSSKTSFNTDHPSSPQLSPRSHCHAKAKKPGVPITQSWVTYTPTGSQNIDQTVLIHPLQATEHLTSIRVMNHQYWTPPSHSHGSPSKPRKILTFPLYVMVSDVVTHL